MTLLINGIILLLILGYAAFTIIRFFKKSKQGKCAACEINKGCGHSMQKAMKKTSKQSIIIQQHTYQTMDVCCFCILLSFIIR